LSSRWFFERAMGVLKVIGELRMYRGKMGINILFYLDDLLFIILGYDVCLESAYIVEEDMRLLA